jgi:hypothetical protein
MFISSVQQFNAFLGWPYAVSVIYFDTDNESCCPTTRELTTARRPFAINPVDVQFVNEKRRSAALTEGFREDSAINDRRVLPKWSGISLKSFGISEGDPSRAASKWRWPPTPPKTPSRLLRSCLVFYPHVTLPYGVVGLCPVAPRPLARPR